VKLGLNLIRINTSTALTLQSCLIMKNWRCVIAKLMKAAVVRQFGRPLNIEEVPIPAPGPGEVLVKIMATGVCHTDLHAADGDWPVKPSPPFIPGHEGAGIVAAVGGGVTTLKEGDPVGIAWLHDACGCCELGDSVETQHDSGYSVNGSFAEYAIGSAAYVARLPANVDFVAMAPILCAGVTTYKGIKRPRPIPVSGSRFLESADSATSRFNTQKPWDFTLSRSTSPRKSLHWHGVSGPSWRSMPERPTLSRRY
jgi:Alcohol dehydrogenase GroES-like domain